MAAAAVLMTLVQVWGAIGLFTALIFLTVGMDRIDEDARGAYVFRPLLLPGIMLIWPLVLWRWWQLEAQAAPWLKRYQPVRKSYGVAVCAMTLAIVLALILGLGSRQEWPSEVQPEQLGEVAQ